MPENAVPPHTPAERPRVQYDFAAPTTDDHFEAFASIASDAFDMPLDQFGPLRKRAGDLNFRILTNLTDQKIVAGLLIIPMGQWFGGKSVPMAGIGAVAVDPAAQSKGAGSTLMQETIRDLHQQGIALSTLYPATQPVYRRVGYEQAGGHYQLFLNLAQIDPQPIENLEIQSIDVRNTEDRAIIERIYRQYAQTQNGLLDRGDYIWSRVGDHHGTIANGYLIFDPARPRSEAVGYIFYIQKRDRHGDDCLIVRDATVLTADAGRRLLRFCADHRSVVDKLEWRIPPTHFILNLFREQPYEMVLKDLWMLRIVNVERALALRGYPVQQAAELHLEVHGDTVLPELNNLRFVLQLDPNGSSPTVEKNAGRGDFRIHLNGLAALYSGHLSAHDLVRLGLAEGELESLQVATTVFSSAAQPPHLVDMF